jgi:hypothetical protein
MFILSFFSTVRFYSYKKVITQKDIGQAVAQLVEALRYNSVGRGFDYACCHFNFSLT